MGKIKKFKHYIYLLVIIIIINKIIIIIIENCSNGAVDMTLAFDSHCNTFTNMSLSKTLNPYLLKRRATSDI